MSSSKIDELIYKINELNEKVSIMSNNFEKLNTTITLLKDDIQINTKAISDLSIATFSGNKEELIIKNVKREKIVLPTDLVTKFLSLANVTGDVKMFKEYYINGVKQKKLIPFRKINDKKYQYWNNNKWNDDNNAEELLDIISRNIQIAYLSANDFDNIKDSDIFIKNQKHIASMTEPKNQKKLLTYIEKEFQTI